MGRLFTSSELAAAYQLDPDRVLAVSMNGTAFELDRTGSLAMIGGLIPDGMEVSLGSIPSFDRDRVSIPFGVRGKTPSGVVTIAREDLGAKSWLITGSGFLSNLPSGRVVVLEEGALTVYDDTGTATKSFATDLGETGSWALVR